MRKKKNYLKLFSLIFMILFCCAFQTIVYSAINGTMTVKGDAYARVEADVRITGFRLNRTLNATSSYEEFGKNHITTEIGLLNPSSSISYYVEITNYGSEDVGIFDITGLPSVVNYSIEDYNLHDKICDDTGKCNNFAKKTLLITLTTTDSFAGSIQMNFDFRTCHKVTYTDIENKGYPTEVIDGGTLNITFKDDLKRVQVLSNNNELAYYKQVSNGQTITINNVFNDVEVKIKEQVAKLVNGDINEVGSEVCIKDECFHIISNDGTTVRMLSKYNLYVGGTYNVSTSTWIAYGEESTGMQDSTMLGNVLDTAERKGVTATGTNTGCENIYSITTKYIDDYAELLQKTGIEILNIEMMDMTEFRDIGNCVDSCEIESSTSSGSSSSRPTNPEPCESGYTYVCDTTDWLTRTSFWLNGVLYGCESGSNIIRTFNNTTKTVDTNEFTNNKNFGVRPVIEIDVNEIFVPLKPVIVSGDYNTVGSEITIGNEHFYVISSDSESVTLLSKMNITVNTSPIQSSSAPTKLFSSLNYWGNVSAGTYIYDSRAEIYNYVENYKDSLVKQGVEIEEARLIKVEELESLGCNKLSLSCSAAPSWVYGTSYWTGSNYDDYYIWIVNNSNTLLYDGSNVGFEYGVRPVIKISKPYIEFTIDGITYKAKEGMTWLQWVNSEYNTSEIVIKNCIYLAENSSSSYFLASMNDGVYVTTTSLIDSSLQYYIKKQSESGGPLPPPPPPPYDCY